jgi:hypothetical protein
MNAPLNNCELPEVVDVERRALLGVGVRLSVAVAFVNVAMAQAETCTDPDELSGAQRSMRKAAEYKSSYANEKETCRHCVNFTATEGDCGSCRALGGPVEAGGHCTSWMARTDGK